MGWVREGECPPERCQGQCCKHVGIWLEPEADAIWMQTRGLEVKAVGERFIVDIPQRCAHLTDNNLCDLYGQPSRPKNCEDWPISPSNTLLDDCGYTFRFVEDAIGVT